MAIKPTIPKGRLVIKSWMYSLMDGVPSKPGLIRTIPSQPELRLIKTWARMWAMTGIDSCFMAVI